MTEQQWLQIYRDTVHPFYGYTARRTGGNRALAEDIVQESYLRALNTWNRKTVPDSPLAWLKRVARNLLIDYLRRKGRDSGRDPDCQHDSAGGQFESLELFLAISSLGHRKAVVIEAFYYDGKSTSEIAAHMNISKRAVEGQLRRARQSLKSLLSEPKPNGGQHEQEI
ncbi:MAG: sigma-70 family RNA polymerase sigma factor [Candidatus Aminicenantes bacterium]|nr:sigma-70 family RNA polymerase sigma factor [Candidatus Aminicenantes bacterium]